MNRMDVPCERGRLDICSTIQTRRHFLRQTVAGVAGMLPIGWAGILRSRQGGGVLMYPARLPLAPTSSSIPSACAPPFPGEGRIWRARSTPPRYLGLRWLRVGYESNIPVADLLELHKQTGVRFSYGLMSGGTDIARLLAGARQLASAGALLALEGNNEPNNWGVTYQGEAGGRDRSWLPVAKLQRDLYTAVKNDPRPERSTPSGASARTAPRRTTSDCSS